MEELNSTIETTPEAQEPEAKTYTEAEVMALLQSESDRRVNEAQKKWAKKYERDMSLSKLDEEARAKQEMSNTIADLQERIAEMEHDKTKLEITKTLANRGIDPLFADLLTFDTDIENAQRQIGKFADAFERAVSKRANELVGQTASIPQSTGYSVGDALTRDEFNKLSLSEQQRVYQSDPELYRQLTKRR